MTAPSIDAAPIKGPFMVDAHVYVDDVFDRPRLIHGAFINFRRAAAELGLDPVSSGVLMLSEDSRYDCFREFAAEERSSGPWTFEPTDEAESLFLDGAEGPPILFVAGRQILTAERLEVLALGCAADFQDGAPLDATLRAARERERQWMQQFADTMAYQRRGLMMVRARESGKPQLYHS